MLLDISQGAGRPLSRDHWHQLVTDLRPIRTCRLEARSKHPVRQELTREEYRLKYQFPIHAESRYILLGHVESHSLVRRPLVK